MRSYCKYRLVASVVRLLVAMYLPEGFLWSPLSTARVQHYTTFRMVISCEADNACGEDLALTLLCVQNFFFFDHFIFVHMEIKR